MPKGPAQIITRRGSQRSSKEVSGPLQQLQPSEVVDREAMDGAIRVIKSLLFGPIWVLLGPK